MSSTIAKPLLAWFAREKRDLPWRTAPRDPYRTWVSEVMLQQTRVETVLPYFSKFLRRFPTLQSLAAAPLDDVLAHWSGLGYYARARNLHKAAIASKGTLPASYEKLLELPGFGPYTAAAVASLAFGEDVALVDGNVARVFARLFCISDGAREKSLPLAQEHLPKGRAAEYNEALMELGALVCTPRSPKCLLCPLRNSCHGKDSPELYPAPRLRKPKALLEWNAFALVRGEEVLMSRVSSKSLFGGLWELPRAVPEGLRVGKLESCGIIEQTLTHREVRVTVQRARASGKAMEGFAWTAPEGLARHGLSSLTRKTLKAARLTERASSGSFRRP
jgi:A/G-specific adenine glycosylase